MIIDTLPLVRALHTGTEMIYDAMVMEGECDNRETPFLPNCYEE
jgi:hypothetical protein